MLKFLIKFILSISILTSILWISKDSFAKLLRNRYETHLNHSINDHKYELNRMVELVQENDLILFNLYFVDPVDFNNSTVKNIEVNIFNEFLFPITLLIVLFLSVNINYKRLIFSLLIIVFLLYYKILLIVYDNYSYPDYILKDLSVFYYPVYIGNVLIAEVGTAINILLVILIWFTVNSKDIIKGFDNLTQVTK